ncbi:tRNA (5-methylaminomethyl-2-thiouridine)(34)-methyltransferase MnmD [Oceanithermus desulfurans]
MEVWPTGDGSLSLRHPVHGEGYHPAAGAAAQAERLYLRASGVHADPRPRVFELGFGLGVNFAVTLRHARRRGAFLDYRAVESEPVPLEVLEAVLRPLDGALFERLAPRWGGSFELVGASFRLRLEVARVQDAVLGAGPVGAVYFDPFSPRANPDVWTPAVYRRMFGLLEPGGVLVTYSVAGRVRRGLAAAGFAVERIPGWGGKRHWLRARRPA